MAKQAETCPQCGNETLTILPGAKRKSCSLCHYIQPEEPDDSPESRHFQGYTIDRSKFKRKKKLNLSSPILTLLLMFAAYTAYQYFNQEPEELEGLRSLERSYHKVTRLITPEALASSTSRAKLRVIIKREKAVVLHLRVSTCLNHPKIYLSNLYTIFDKGLAKPHFDFKHSRRVISISSKFVNGASACKETYAPNQFSTLQLYSDFPETK
ncbi:MAG: hypothetical protein AB7I41_24295 [Candidatus Sericytochromatia bacterium]